MFSVSLMIYADDNCSIANGSMDVILREEELWVFEIKFMK